jgi:hypothetical protein
MSDQVIVIGYRGPRPNTPGSVNIACRDCDTRLWFSPNSMDKILEGALPLCIDCANKATKNERVEFGGYS